MSILFLRDRLLLGFEKPYIDGSMLNIDEKCVFEQDSTMEVSSTLVWFDLGDRLKRRSRKVYGVVIVTEVGYTSVPIAEGE